MACKNGHINVVEWLAEHTSRLALRIHQPDNTRCTPIFSAVRGLHVKVVLLLLELGVNPDIPDQMGQTPMQIADGCVISSSPTGPGAAIIRCLQMAREQMPVLCAEQCLALAKLFVLGTLEVDVAQIKKLEKTLQQISEIEAKMQAGQHLDDAQQVKLAGKARIGIERARLLQPTIDYFIVDGDVCSLVAAALVAKQSVEVPCFRRWLQGSLQRVRD